MTNDWELDHLGIAVNNLEDAIGHYQRLGFELLAPAALKPCYGSSSRACFIQNQSFRIELIQPAADGAVFREHMDNYGEGAVLFGFRVKDLAGEKARLVEQGIPVISSISSADGREAGVLFDTRESGNVMMALYSGPSALPAFRPSESDWRFNHLGLIVKDTDKLAGYYQSIGFKPLSPPREITFTKVQGWAIYGKMPAAPQVTKAVQFQNRQATFLLEVNQPGDDGSLHREFLDTHGEGINHIHFLVDDPEKELQAMAARGFPAILTARRPDGALHEAFYDTRAIGGICIALWGGMPPFRPKPE